MRSTFLLMLLLCSCATQRRTEKPLDDYTSKPFPPKFYPPAIYAQRPLMPERLQTIPMLDRSVLQEDLAPAAADACPDCKPVVLTKTLYLTDTIQLDSLHRELEIERLANVAIRKRLTDTEADRDYWQEKNQQKFWTLIAMAVFGFLYILFKILASRIRET